MKKKFWVLLGLLMFSMRLFFAQSAAGQIEIGTTKEIGEKEVVRPGILQWSSRSSETMKWQNAMNYCKNLNENGYSDWRLPDIDELRTILKYKERTVTGGVCRVSAKSGCLASNCWSWDTCAKSCDHGWNKCTSYVDGYSKLGDGKLPLWSFSTLSDYKDAAWGVDFKDGYVNGYNKSANSYVRCVRNAD